MGKSRSAAVIVKNNQVLLMRRIKNGNEYFVFPGGKLEPHETPEAAVIREIFEEVTLIIKTTSKPIFERTNEKGGVEYYFLITEFSGTVSLSGEEKDRMNSNNQYYPEWWDITEAAAIDSFKPPEIRTPIFGQLQKLNRKS